MYIPEFRDFLNKEVTQCQDDLMEVLIKNTSSKREFQMVNNINDHPFFIHLITIYQC